jgi:hypothetical protein
MQAYINSGQKRGARGPRSGGLSEFDWPVDPVPGPDERVVVCGFFVDPVLDALLIQGAQEQGRVAVLLQRVASKLLGVERIGGKTWPH